MPVSNQCIFFYLKDSVLFVFCIIYSILWLVWMTHVQSHASKSLTTSSQPYRWSLYFLRIGSVLVSVLFEYSKINEAGLPKWVAEILLYISVSQNYNYICHLVHIAACMHGEYLYSLSRHAFIQLYLISFTVSHWQQSIGHDSDYYIIINKAQMLILSIEIVHLHVLKYNNSD